LETHYNKHFIIGYCKTSWNADSID